MGYTEAYRSDENQKVGELTFTDAGIKYTTAVGYFDISKVTGGIAAGSGIALSKSSSSYTAANFLTLPPQAVVVGVKIVVSTAFAVTVSAIDFGLRAETANTSATVDHAEMGTGTGGDCIVDGAYSEAASMAAGTYNYGDGVGGQQFSDTSTIAVSDESVSTTNIVPVIAAQGGTTIDTGIGTMYFLYRTLV